VDIARAGGRTDERTDGPVTRASCDSSGRTASRGAAGRRGGTAVPVVVIRSSGRPFMADPRLSTPPHHLTTVIRRSVAA